MKKILIVTKIGKNYGAILQGFALKKFLEKSGCDVSILNFSAQRTSDTYRILPRITGFKSFLNYFISIPKYKKSKLSIERFLRFREEHLNLTSQYTCYEDVLNNPPIADIYFTGSDQVWNPMISFDKVYYLLFGDKKIIRASYAASFGIKELPKSLNDEYISRLANIKYKSVRESNGKDILKSFGYDSTVSLDPTLLLDSKDYDKLLTNIPSKYQGKYILLYLLILPVNVDAYVKRIRELFPDYLIVNIPGSSYSKKLGDIQADDLGPKEFLALIKNASYVLTSSFHGTVFSIIYQKKFLSILPEHTGERIKNLLDMVDLSDRIIDSPMNIELLNNDINYVSVQNKLKPFKQDSVNYIKSVLKECDKND